MLMVNQLTGFGVSDGLGFWSFISRTEYSGTSSTGLTLPAGINANDIGIWIEWASNFGGTPTAVTPTGFDQRLNITLNTVRTIAATKKMVGDESGTSPTGMSGQIGGYKSFALFRYSKPYVSLNSSTWSGQFTDSTPSNQTIASSGQSAPLLAFARFGVGPLGGFIDEGNIVFSPTYTELQSSSIDPDTEKIAYKFYNEKETPASHTVGMADSGSFNALLSGYLQLS
jgi:hypothetical protein